jgi:tetratricopeptide (TPR) repeat protein
MEKAVAFIFISYSSKHRDLTRALATEIEAQYGPGSVWWDHALESRAEFEPQIRAALESARVVVVIWSLGATGSDFVYSEASEAARSGKLINVRPADVPFTEIPKPFDIYHVDDLANTDRILATIANVMRGIPVPTRVPLAEVYFRQHGKRVLEEKQWPLPADLRSIAPSEILQAKYGLVRYDDATGMAQQVLAWCLAEGEAAGRLVYGAGGSGKTRLMIEVAARLRQDHGWQAGFLDRPPDDDAVVRQRWQALDQLITHGNDRGLLVVIDYAEARRRELVAIAERLRSVRSEDGPPVRLVLLTRSAGDWWTMFVDDNEALQGLFHDQPGKPATMPIPVMAAGDERLRHLEASLLALEPVMRAQGYLEPAHEASPTQLARIATDREYAHPLAIQMEAMLRLAVAAPEETERGLDPLLSRVLGLERAHWAKLILVDDETERRDLRRGVAQVTAVQGVDTARSAEQLLMADRFYGDRTSRAAVEPMVRHLSVLYGRPNGGIGPLEPDLIGEHHVAGTADVELIEGCLSWLESESESIREGRRKDLLTVLQRSTHAEHGQVMSTRASALLDHIVRNHGKTMGEAIVAVMKDTPGTLFSRLEALVDTLPEPALAAINFALPPRYVPWMEFSLRVAERYATVGRSWKRAAESADLDPDERFSQLRKAAAGMGMLAVRLSNLGRLEEALAASGETVEINRVLAKERPAAFLPDLAKSLTDTAVILRGLDRLEAATGLFAEAGNIYGTLIKDRPVEFLAELEYTLTGFGIVASRLGLHEVALKAVLNAVDTCRAMVEDGSALLPNLAASLNDAGAMLSNLGRHEEAVAASEEAVKIGRQLAEDEPDAFRPDLARNLITLGANLFSLGRGKEAFAATMEATTIFSALVEEHPDGPFFADLTKSLGNIGRMQSAIGRFDDALSTSQQVLENYRALAEDRPDTFRSDLANSLSNVARDLLNVNRCEEALGAAHEAADMYRALAKGRPNAFIPELAQGLAALSETLAATERYAEAAEAAREGLAGIVRSLETQPRPLVDVARSLSHDYVQASEKAGRDVDGALLRRVTKALGTELD